MKKAMTYGELIEWVKKEYEHIYDVNRIRVSNGWVIIGDILAVKKVERLENGLYRLID